ncbi:MAG TPA: type II toxin-antitoxin system VapC family toxin [Gammaproteobacteria bacterium]|nr:type II toxin-antitoxin system VapC family toxin [Gammaproteobacteria bacterium]
MLDTNICSYIIKNRPHSVLEKFKTLEIEDCGISSITLAELRYWVARNKRLHVQSNNPGQPNINEQIINDFVTHLWVIEFDSHAAGVYGDIRDALEGRGEMIGAEDLMIGSHAISLDCILVTNNEREFKRLPGIKLENWLQ